MNKLIGLGIFLALTVGALGAGNDGTKAVRSFHGFREVRVTGFDDAYTNTFNVEGMIDSVTLMFPTSEERTITYKVITPDDSGVNLIFSTTSTADTFTVLDVDVPVKSLDQIIITDNSSDDGVATVVVRDPR
tara:strand:- start:471 stop:866 length:396 start_codon:yes stop_codon:yes gene_type:complete